MEIRSARVIVITCKTVTFPPSLLEILMAYLRADFESWEKSVGTRIFTMQKFSIPQKDSVTKIGILIFLPVIFNLKYAICSKKLLPVTIMPAFIRRSWKHCCMRIPDMPDRKSVV